MSISDASLSGVILSAGGATFCLPAGHIAFECTPSPKKPLNCFLSLLASGTFYSANIAYNCPPSSLLGFSILPSAISIWTTCQAKVVSELSAKQLLAASVTLAAMTAFSPISTVYLLPSIAAVVGGSLIKAKNALFSAPVVAAPVTPDIPATHPDRSLALMSQDTTDEN